MVYITHNQQENINKEYLPCIICLDYILVPDIDYDQVFSLSNFYKRFYQCCSGVRWKASTTQFEIGLICEAANVLHRIATEVYRADGFIIFRLNERGKTRDIAALKIIDRGVQKVLNQDILLPIYLPQFVSGNSASIRGKGLDWAINFLEQQLKKHFAEYGTNGGIYLFDFKNYFRSLPHENIKADLKNNITNQVALKLLIDAINDFRKIPTCYKDQEGHYRGVGLGSEISQSFSLNYVNELDQYVESLGDKGIYYGRYMDDGYIIFNDINMLNEILQKVNEIVQRLGLQLNPKKEKIIFFKHHKFEFLKMQFQLTDTGYVVIKPTRKNITRVRKKIRKLRKLLDNKQLKIEDACNSYNGMRAHLLRSKDSYRTVYNLDLYFVSTFRKELSTYKQAITTYLKVFKNKNGEWVYITKPLKNSKNYNQQYKKQVNNRFRNMNKQQKDKYFKKKNTRKGNIKIRGVYDPEFIQGVKRKNEKPCR